MLQAFIIIYILENACYNSYTATKFAIMQQITVYGLIDDQKGAIMTLSKYHEAEKEYLVFDSEKNEVPLTLELLRSFGYRNFGSNSDGILLLSSFADTSAPYKLLDFSGKEMAINKESRMVFEKYLQNIPPSNVIYFFERKTSLHS